MVKIKVSVNALILIFLLVRTVGVLSRDLSENERAVRAAFIQRLLNNHKYLEGRLVLKGGPNRFEDFAIQKNFLIKGNVYIYHAGRWGAVCDDSWDDAAAHVVCQTAFNRTGTATHGGKYGEATVKFWMDDVVCQGDEKFLSQCVFTGWGSSDCELSEAAGVICRDNIEGIPELLKKNKDGRKLHEVLDARTSSLRLVGGRSNHEGRVEILHDGIWGSICPDGWTLYEASAVCRHLALGFAEQAIQTDYFGNSKVVLSGVQCDGNETNLFMCKHQEYGDVTCPGETGHVAAVVCTRELADLILDARAIERSAHLQDVMMFHLQCAMEENCLSKSAYEIQKNNPNWQYETRRLLRFTASSLNAGNAEFRPYLPKHLWQWHLCHMHYHSMEVFATFDILDASGRRVAEGHKASFCLEDNTCLPGVEKKYSCKNYGDQAKTHPLLNKGLSQGEEVEDMPSPLQQYGAIIVSYGLSWENPDPLKGVSVNCSDVYMYNIDCQWVDVTDVDPGNYKFKVAVNPHARIAEQSFHNNAATCNLMLSETYAAVYGCTLERP